MEEKSFGSFMTNVMIKYTSIDSEIYMMHSVIYRNINPMGY